MPMPTHFVAVGGLVMDSQGDVLVGWSNWRTERAFYGGQVENGENLEEALVARDPRGDRITTRVASFAGIYSNLQARTDADTGVYIPTKLMLDVRREYASGAPTDSDETKEVMWVSAARAPELVNTQPCRMRLENMANHVAGVAQVAYETHPLSVRFRRAFGPTYAPRAAVRYR